MSRWRSSCASYCPPSPRLARQREPLLSGLNAAPTAAVARTDWARYPYTVLLVPGSGPEQPGVALDLAGAQCCRAGQAPFIVVLGGMCTRFTRRFVRQLR